VILNPSVGKEKEFLSLTEFFQELEINIPPYVLAELKENYNLLVFSRVTGKRLGLITEIKNPQALKEQLRFWEQTMLGDFKNFYPDQSPGESATQDFQDAVYKDISIRYINLPNPDLALNYAIMNNVFIIGTSKDMMYMIVDNLLKSLY